MTTEELQFRLNMITRRNLAEQLRDYQLRSERDWSSLSFWASTNRSDGSTAGRWRVFTCIFFIFAAGVLYVFRDIRLSLTLLGIAVALFTCFRTVRSRLAKRRQRRVLP